MISIRIKGRNHEATCEFTQNKPDKGGAPSLAISAKKQLFGFKFRRQEGLGNYIVDFVCLDAKLIIEVDGGQHLEQQEHDEKRTAYLNSLGYRVIRYWNHQVLNETGDVIADIMKHLSITPP